MTRTRIAWFSPWPPDRSDAARRSAEVVPALRARGYEIDVISRTSAPTDRPAGNYDLAVYHLADAPEHDFVWDHVFTRPGLTVLHDGRLHRARSRVLLQAARVADYRAEFAWNHPHVAPAIAELAVHGHDGPFSVQWSMVGAVIAASRLVATHAASAVSLLHAEQPNRTMDYIPASDDAGTSAPADEIRRELRRRIGWPEDALVFGVFGPLGLEWRVPQILRALAAVRARMPKARLLLAGPADPDLDVPSLVRSLGLDDVVSIQNDADVRATDVVLAMRWPAALDLPGAWLQALAASRATVILDLVHLANVPTLDPRTWKRHAPADRSQVADAAGVAVAIDVMDEDHSLRLALQRLGTDADLRARLGRAGRAYWETEHSLARMIDGYARAIQRAMALPAPDTRSLPRHLQPS